MQHLGQPCDMPLTSRTGICVWYLPGCTVYVAGLAYAVTESPPANPMQSMPKKLRATSRREADYLLRYIDCE